MSREPRDLGRLRLDHPIPCIVSGFYQRKFSGETSESRTIPTASCFIMGATTSSREPHHHQVVGKCERSGTRKARLKNSRRQTLFFSGKVAVRGRRWRVSVSAVARLDRGKCSTKCARDKSSISRRKSKKKTTDGLRRLLDDEVDNMCTRV